MKKHSINNNKRLRDKIVSLKYKKIENGITLITLVITIIILLILAGVLLSLVIGENGLLKRTSKAEEVNKEATATEKMEFKITYFNMESYGKNMRKVTLQELAEGLFQDKEVAYIKVKNKKIASLTEIDVKGENSIFVKLTEYPYEFEIDNALHLASIDGIKIADNTTNISREEYNLLLERIKVLENGGNTNPTGTIIAYSVDTVPNGYLKCEGQEVSRTEYKTLFDIIGTTYGEGDGTTTFNVPNLNGKFLKGDSIAGKYQEAGLPNIEGNVTDLLSQDGTGAFRHYASEWMVEATKAGSLATFGGLVFKASNFNSIYGKSTTVTPENMSVVYCIKY